MAGTWKRLYSDRSSEARHRRTSKIELSKNVAYIPWYTVRCAAYRLHCRNSYGQANKSILNLYVGTDRKRCSKKENFQERQSRCTNPEREQGILKAPPRSWRQNQILEKQFRVSTYWTRTRKFTTRSRKSTRTDDPRWYPIGPGIMRSEERIIRLLGVLRQRRNLSRTCETYFYKLRSRNEVAKRIWK